MEEERAKPRGPLGWLGRNRVVSGIILVLVAALATGSLGLWESPVSASGKRVGPAESVKNFARGQASFDAQLIWNSLSEDLTNVLESQGQDVSSIQGQLDALKDRGVRYTEVTYVGGHRAASGESYFLYVFARKNGEATEGIESVPYVFVVDGSGKILRIE